MFIAHFCTAELCHLPFHLSFHTSNLIPFLPESLFILVSAGRSFVGCISARVLPEENAWCFSCCCCRKMIPNGTSSMATLFPLPPLPLPAKHHKKCGRYTINTYAKLERLSYDKSKFYQDCMLGQRVVFVNTCI